MIIVDQRPQTEVRLLGRYALTLGKDGDEIHLAISPEAMAMLMEYCDQECWLLQYLERDFGLKREAFEPFGESRFGYGNVLFFTEADQPEVIIGLPEVIIGLKDQLLLSLAGSLMVMFRCLNFGDQNEEGLREPMEIDLELKHGSFDLHVQCSEGLHSWLGERYGYGTETPLPFVKEAMLRAGAIVKAPESKSWWNHLRAEMLPMGAFHLHCDSNCCCMGPGGAVLRGSSFYLATHNCDSPTNLLVFLTGLAAVSGQYLADEEA